ncbi:DUF2971 domain-containing protein [Flavobacterium orientale]|uniref:DUF2971 domain-containing protein n=1 Tax=Flavobacterium orientale TaxID=1756020 RepID=A0A916Y4B7_9FLAO|nr:DUF2971 domain-containing protein [Flavobacterium orientale]GGD30464.1 hypothetical protein GCM10011343_20810 [Flavobacterium orientale]
MSNQHKFWQKKNPNLIFYDSFVKPIYKYVSYETAIKILESNTLNYSSPLSFNDPFDMTTSFIDCNLDAEDIALLFNDLDMPLENKQHMIFLYQKQPELLSKLFEETFKDEQKNFGISCFSKSYENTLMWSHYSDKHNGICLGFTFKDYNNENFFQASVNYVDKLVKNHIIKNTKQTMYDWAFTKSHVWQYEEEVRRIHINGNGLIPFIKKDLYGIYYGLRVTNERIYLIEKLLAKNEYDVKERKKMEINPETFDLIAIDNKLP